jgi:hypothetical protein
MANVGGSVLAKTAVGTAFKIYNLDAPTANTEVSQALSSNATRLEFKSRLGGKLQYAFTSTQSSTNFITVPAYCNETLDNFKVGSLTLYVQSNKASDTIEILEFY